MSLLTEVNRCLENIAERDANYGNCIFNTGVLLRNQNGFCISSCEDCCSLVGQWTDCETELVDCKDKLDTVLKSIHDCGWSTADVLMVLVFVLTSVVCSVVVVVNRMDFGKGAGWKRRIWSESRQIGNVVWKNFILKRRKWKSWLVEMMLPLVFSGILVVLANLESVVEDSEKEDLEGELELEGCDALEMNGKPSKALQSLYNNLQPVVGIFFLLTYLRFVAALSAAMVLEKETKIREGLKMMGVPDRTLALSWYGTHCILFTPLALILALEVKYGKVFPSTSLGSIFLFFWSFGLAMVSFCFMVAPWHDRSKTVALSAAFLWVLLYFPFYMVENKSIDNQLFAALCAPTAFGLGVNDMAQQAQRGTGVANAISNWESPIEDVSTTAMTNMLLLDAFLMFVLGWYFDKVVPQEFGVPLPYHFFLKKAYWVAENRQFDTGSDTAPFFMIDSPIDSNISHPNNVDPDKIQDVPDELARQEDRGECVAIDRLCKVFTTTGEDRIALNQLSLKFYSGQITSLLGHNGAGKSTLISILSGLTVPTSGTAKVFGNSILTEMPKIRKVMGICPQHDVLYDDMTVVEHLEFYATIKQLPLAQLKATVKKSIEDVGLVEKRDQATKNLSGGQKRKLSVAVALIGDSKIVFLDEPTSGMDPFSRRFTWNLLRKHRKNRVIILTTHFMDEADILGDRIAIIADGALCCVGTSLFLKNRYGAGYNLTISKKPGCNVESIAIALQSFVPSATILVNVSLECVFQLPIACSNQIPDVLEYLDQHLSNLGIEEYGISVTTLEAVFLRIAHDRDAKRPEIEVSEWQNSVVERRSMRNSHIVPNSKLHATFSVQFCALLQKRIRYAKRDKKSFCFGSVLPLLFLIVLVTLPGINVASYLPDYDLAAREALGNYDSCVDSLTTSTEFQNCAFGTTTIPGFCGQQCKTDRVACNTKACGISGTGSSVNDRAYCPVNGIMEQQFLPLTICSDVWYNYCDLGIVNCDSSVCCNRRDVNSAFFPCSKCKGHAWPCHTAACLDKSDVVIQATVNTFIATIVIILAFSFIPAVIIVYVVKEKHAVQNAKHQQFISGAGAFAYWSSLYLWDVLNMQLPVLICAAFLATYDGFKGDLESITSAFALLVMYSFTIVSLTYIISFWFQIHSKAQTYMLVFSVFSGAILSILSYVSRLVNLQLSSTLTLTKLDSYLSFVYLLFPGYALQEGLFQIGMRKVGDRFTGPIAGIGTSCPLKAMCWTQNVPGCCNPSAWEFAVAGRSFTYLLVEALVFFYVVLLLERRESQPNHSMEKMNLSASSRLAEQEAIMLEDSDVQKERIRVQQGSLGGENVVLNGLRKVYRPNKKIKNGKIALHNLSLAISPGECFGYLGVNGAGKSSTLKILSGIIAPSMGVASLGGFDVATQQPKIRKLIGYCPQFDALLDLLTVEEHLELFAKIKGVKSRHVRRVIDDKIRQLDLHLFRDKLTKGLSGGNKRKLSAAIALIGNPSIVFMDEPSTGMDPSARRKMWDVISDVVTFNASTVVLTTHSMEECQALCNRVGILVSGRLQCLGSTQHLKSKFGQGYSVDVRLMEVSETTISQIQSEIVDRYQDQVESVVDLEGKTHLHILNENHIRIFLANDVVRLEKVLGFQGTASNFQNFAEQGRLSIPIRYFSNWLALEELQQKICEFFYHHFDNSTLVEQFGNSFTFQIPNRSVGLAGLFRLIESNKSKLHIKEYSVSETTLEQIFNHFAANQVEESLPFERTFERIQKADSIRNTRSEKSITQSGDNLGISRLSVGNGV